MCHSKAAVIFMAEVTQSAKCTMPIDFPSSCFCAFLLPMLVQLPLLHFFEVIDLVRFLVNGLTVASEILTNKFPSSTTSSHFFFSLISLGDILWGLFKGGNTFSVVLLPPSSKVLSIRPKASQLAKSQIVISSSFFLY